MKKDIRFSSRIEVSNFEYNTNPEKAIRMAHERLFKMLADHIADQCTEMISLENHKEFRLDLYVANPTEYWKAVNEKAIEIARTMKYEYK
jgi:hypothetical protein